MSPLWTFAPAPDPHIAENIRSATSPSFGDGTILLDLLLFAMHGLWHACCGYRDESVKNLERQFAEQRSSWAGSEDE
ncbi:MAG: hypothetical protein LZF60_70037 [Nitrospira sp.]|nr:MAG: hypothetical protein LZF60_70037 [Nitrospira sp.]